MKKCQVTIFCIVIMGLMIFNFSFLGNGQQNGNFSLKNMKILQASAGEYNCDLSTPNCCSYPNMESNGVLSYTY